MAATHGKDYLIDYYSLLGLERDADEAAIKKAYHEKQRAYHPDRCEGLADEIKILASEKSLLLAEAYATLCIDHNRAAYDRLLSGWTGPISKNGMPIVDLRRPHFSPGVLLEDGSGVGVAESFLQQMMQLTGHDPATLALLEKMHAASETPAADLVEALRRALYRQQTYLAVLEDLHWQSAGFKNLPIKEDIGPEYAETIEERIQIARENALSGIDQTLMLAATGELKQLGAGAGFDPDSPDAAKMLTQFRADAVACFEAAAERIRGAATNRAANAARALALVTGVYDPPGQALQSKLLVLVKAGEKETPFACRLEGTEITAGIDAPAVDDAIAAGFSVIRLEVCEGLDIPEQLKKVMIDHFERWFENSQKT